MWPTIIATALGAWAQYQGQQQANASNERIADQATAMNVAEADRNRKFQEQMSSTSHTREVADLKNAGLNPVISGTGGASTPSGGQGSAMTAKMENEFGGAQSLISSAVESVRSLKAIDQAEAATDLTRAQTEKLRGVDTSKTREEITALRRNRPESELKNRVYDYFNKKVDQINSGSAYKEHMNKLKEQQRRKPRPWDSQTNQMLTP